MFLKYDTLLAQALDGHIALIAFNRPGSANAINTQMALELADAFNTLANEPLGVRAVILTGQGKHFCAGVDLKERKDMDEPAWRQQHKAMEQAMEAVLYCPQPVIAAVGGAAYGGGLELALACDFIYASHQARFALSETSLGIMPGMGGTQQLPRRVGMAMAKELIYKAEPFSAEQAHAYGMTNKTCSTDTLLFEAMSTAKTIAINAPLAVQNAKQAIKNGSDLKLSEALQCELSHYNRLLNTKDRHEGVNAFHEKRKPLFKGE